MVVFTTRFLSLVVTLATIGLVDLNGTFAAPLPGQTRLNIVLKDADTVSAFTTSTTGADAITPRSLPLTRYDQRDQVGHPLMLLQHHMNKADVKLARMKGRALPTQQEQHAAVEKRKRDIEAMEQAAVHAPFSSITTSKTQFASGNRGRIGVVLPDRSAIIVNKKQKSFSLESRQADAPAAANANGFPQAALAAANSNNLQTAQKPTAAGTLGLDIEANDVGYIATIQIGSNNTDFRMLIDSGSADTWVPTSPCSSCSKNHQVLTKQVSSTLATSTTPFSITYGTGAVSGFLGTDDYKIAGYNLTSHSIALITKETTDFSADSVPFDGLMGLAMKNLSNSEQPTPIDALFAADQVSAPVMGYHLARAADNDNDGEVTFGGVNANKYNGSLVEIPNVSPEGFYEIPIQGVSFGGSAIDGIPSNATAILDTGTTLMVAPADEAKLIHAQIPGSSSDGNGGFTIPCNTTQQLSFTFGGREWPLNSEDMVFLPIDDNNLNGDCISALSGGSIGAGNEWLLGATFLKNVYFATNAQANVVGLGQLV